ncbi:MAG: hypothetical protein DHS20C11_20020 [Lysobacteraceae bacterium]|nr:MAG: hypothetical protein DHS20C11_20020 [Xanthomonadaceae bacterium]
MNATSNLKFGWLALAFFISVGLFLESLHLFKTPFYFEHDLRRELWVLGHAHGALMAILNIVYALTALRYEAVGNKLDSWLWLLAGLFIPAGFLLGGVTASEVDPALWIVLTPMGALCALVASARAGMALLRHRQN